MTRPGKRPSGAAARTEGPHLDALHLDVLERRYPSRWLRAAYCGVNAFVALLLMAVIALVTRQPFLFPSLGPTAFLLFRTPEAPTASPRNTVYGHLIGVLAGWSGLAVTGLLDTGPDLMHVDWRRVLAAVIALGLTCTLMPVFRADHPPAGATTLIVALGLLRSPAELATIMLAVLVLTAQGFLINRLAGLPYPVWRHPRDERKSA
ncbi:HPP family protein [Streptomyces sp. NPDC047117]|uniref:HPP family protein n=1 Tax=Streptomyces sp. NPDC047117 TaxID=3155379 RepID=UPI00340B41BF